MAKKVIVFIVLFTVLFQGAALAASGSIILEDTLYGALVGGILGGAWYLLDEDDLGKKVGTGVAVGAIAGFILGVADATSLVVIDEKGIRYGVPQVYVMDGENGLEVTTSLIGAKF